MPDDVILTTDLRTSTGTSAARRLRRAGRLPAVLYGHGQACVHLSLVSEEMESALRHGHRVVDINLGTGPEKALIKEVQHDAMGDRLVHVDLARIAADERVKVTVSIELKGSITGEGHQLQQPLHEVEIECLAVAIPESLTLFIGDMKVGDMLTVADLRVPEGVKMLTPADTTVVHLAEALEVEEEELEAEPGAAEPEIIGAKPEEGEEDEENK